MSKDHLHILHLPPTTPDDKINKVCQERYRNLMVELINQGITNYTIWEGEYNAKNTKEAITKGHQRIVKYAKDNNLPYIVIAEDDIVFSHPNSYQYFLSQMPEVFHVYSGLVYAGELKENRIVNGASGTLTLFVVSASFYSEFLSMATNAHLDRELANTAFKHLYYCCLPFVCTQRGGFSMNLKRVMFYSAYLEGKELYKG